MYKTILVPLDGSNRAETILPYVEELAHRFSSKVILFQVVETPFFATPSGQPDITLYLKEMERCIEEATKYLIGFQGEFQKKNLDASIDIGKGPVVEAIINTAERNKVDLIAIASHGRSGLAQVFYGSVAAGVLQRVDRPLLLIRSQAG